MATEVKRRRGTTAQHLQFTGAEAEITVDTDKYTLLVHDDSGSAPTGHELLRQDFSNVTTLKVDTTYSETGNEVQGEMFWNSDEETVTLVTNGVNFDLGQTVEIHVNSAYDPDDPTPIVINKGEVVYSFGTIGNSGRITVKKMIADGTIAAKRVLGIAAENIVAGNEGKVIKFGKLRKINTNAYNEGDILYVSTSSAGALQTTEPSAGDISLPLAYVVTKSATVGEIFVRVTPIDENAYQPYDADLSTIAGLAKTDGNFIVGNGSAWVAESGATARTSLGLGNVENIALSTYTGQGGALDNQYITNGAGYITGYTETDPVFSASEAASITSTDTTNWDAAYSWGDHASAGYLTSFDVTTQTDPKYLRSDASDAASGVITFNAAGVATTFGSSADGSSYSPTEGGSTASRYWLRFDKTNNASYPYLTNRTASGDVAIFTGTAAGGAENEHFRIKGGDGTVDAYFTNANVGIGTTSPASELDVEGTIQANNLKLQNLVTNTSDTSVLTIDQGQDVRVRTLGSNAFSSTSYLPLSGGTVTNSIKLTGGSLIHEHNSNGGYIPHPDGAFYQTTTNSHTGAIKIKLPVDADTTQSDMVKFVVDVFDYTSNESFSVQIAGYLYTSTNEWVNCSANILADHTNRDFNVRFGRDVDNKCVWIGETTSTWSYPQVIVRDFYGGFLTDIDEYASGWDISFVTAFDTVDETQSSNFPVARTAQQLQTARTITLGGDLSGSASFDGSSDVTISAQVSNNSHTHDDRYLQLTGGTVTGMTIFEDGMRVGTGNHYTDGRASITFAEGDTTSDAMYIEYDGDNLSGDSNGIFIGSNKAGVGDVLKVEYGGNVGIGTTSPSHKFQVEGDSAIASINGTTTNGKPMLVIGEQNSYGVGFRWDSGLSLDIVDFDNTTPTTAGGTKIGHFKIRNEEFYWKGNVGIGDTTPDFKLQVATPTESTDPISFAFDITRENSGVRGMTFGMATDDSYGAIGTHNADLQLGHTFGTEVGGQPAFYPTLTIQHVDQSAGNVGIGDTTPTAKLDVNGAIRAVGGSFSSGTDTNTGGAYIIPKGKKILIDDGNYLRTLIYQNSSSGNIEIGQNATSLINNIALFTGSSGSINFHTNGSTATATLNSSGDLDLTGDLSIGGELTVTKAGSQISLAEFRSTTGYAYINIGGASAYDSGIIFTEGGNANTDTNKRFMLGYDESADRFRIYQYYKRDGVTSVKQNRFVIDDNGNVGINEITPSYKLDVNGTGRFVNDLYANDYIIVGDGNNYPVVRFERNGGSDVGAIGWHTDNTFYVAGHPSFGPTAGNDVRVYGFGSDLHLGDSVNGDVLTVQKSSGNVGIGTTTPSAKLDVNGDAEFSDTVTILDNVAGTFQALVLNNLRGTQDEVGNVSKLSFQHNSVNAGEIRSVTTEDFTTTANQSADLSFHTIHNGTLSERVRINDDGNVGIGTTSPDEKLHVEGSVLIDAANLGAETGIFFREGFSQSNKYNLSILAYDHNGNFPDGMSINAYDGISFSTGSNNRNERMRLTQGGNVGIGETSPAQKLHVNSGTANFVARFESTDDKASILLEDDDTLNYINSQNGYLSLGGDSGLDVGNLNIHSTNGNVGIGSTNPSNTLVLRRASSGQTEHGLRLEYVEDAAPTTTTSSVLVGDYGLKFKNHNSNRNFLFETGNVGIGTTNPSTKLDVVGGINAYSGTSNNTLNIGRNPNEKLSINVNDSNITLTADQDSDSNGGHGFILDRTFEGTGANYFDIRKGGSAQLRIDTNGNVGIGTTSPTNPLHVYDATSDAPLRVQSGDTHTGITFQDNNATNHLFYYGSQNHFYFNGSGVTLGVGVNSVTTTNLSLDVENKVRASGIMFGTDTTDANTLDDYEEGTFTPTIHAGASNIVAHSNNYGKYTKIGNVVHCSGRFQSTSLTAGSSSTNVEIGGLPFSAVVSGLNSGTGCIAGSIGFASGFSGEKPTAMQIRQNEPNAFLYYQNSSFGFSNLKGNDFSSGANTIVFQITYHVA